MLTAEEARAMTRYAHTTDHYFNEYRAKANGAIQAAVERGQYFTSFSFKIFDEEFEEEQYSALNRLAVALEKDYGYKVVIYDSEPKTLPKANYSQICVTINWKEDENV